MTGTEHHQEHPEANTKDQPPPAGEPHPRKPDEHNQPPTTGTENEHPRGQKANTPATTTTREAAQEHQEPIQKGNKEEQNRHLPTGEPQHLQPKGPDQTKATNQENGHLNQEPNTPATAIAIKAEPVTHHPAKNNQGTPPEHPPPPERDTTETPEGGHRHQEEERHQGGEHHLQGGQHTKTQTEAERNIKMKQALTDAADLKALKEPKELPRLPWTWPRPRVGKSHRNHPLQNNPKVESNKMSTKKESHLPEPSNHNPPIWRETHPSCQKAAYPTCQKAAYPTCQKAAYPTCQKAAYSSCQKAAYPTCQKTAYPSCQKAVYPPCQKAAYPSCQKAA